MSKKALSEDRGNLSREYKFYLAFVDAVPNLSAYIREGQADTRFLRVKCRGVDDWVSVLGTFDEDGTPCVAFGTGVTALASLLALNATINRGDFRGDRFE